MPPLYLILTTEPVGPVFGPARVHTVTLVLYYGKIEISVYRTMFVGRDRKWPFLGWPNASVQLRRV